LFAQGGGEHAHVEDVVFDKENSFTV